MSKYKVGDRVIVEKSNVDQYFGSHKGKTGTIVKIEGTSYPYLVHMDFDNSKIWCEVAGYMEEKKMFTKSDLRNGDVILRNNGAVEIAIVDLGVFISKNGWMPLDRVNEDLTSNSGDHDWDIKAVRRPNEEYGCQFNAFEHSWGELVYDRERDTKKSLYNGKVVCIEQGGNSQYTVGKIYQFKDGMLTADNGRRYPTVAKIYSFNDWANWTSGKFIEVVE